MLTVKIVWLDLNSEKRGNKMPLSPDENGWQIKAASDGCHHLKVVPYAERHCPVPAVVPYAEKRCPVQAVAPCAVKHH